MAFYYKLSLWHLYFSTSDKENTGVNWWFLNSVQCQRWWFLNCPWDKVMVMEGEGKSNLLCWMPLLFHASWCRKSTFITISWHQHGKWRGRILTWEPHYFEFPSSSPRWDTGTGELPKAQSKWEDIYFAGRKTWAMLELQGRYLPIILRVDWENTGIHFTIKGVSEFNQQRQQSLSVSSVSKCVIYIRGLHTWVLRCCWTSSPSIPNQNGYWLQILRAVAQKHLGTQGKEELPYMGHGI